MFKRILKFGGSSVGSPERIKSVIDIIKESNDTYGTVSVVVSAFGGVTDQLIALGKMASKDKNSYQQLLAELCERHRKCAYELISQDRLPHAIQAIELSLQELHNILEGISLIKELSPKTLDVLMSFGERLSAYIIAMAMQAVIPQTKFLDAREVIETDNSYGNARVDFKATNHKIQHYFKANPSVSIITGFIASSKDSETTTLGRGGSDYTVAIVGAALNVEIIEIWTDVNGVMTADPRKEPFAFSIPEMSYKEAMEMSHFGAKVIHPPTVIPALEKQIPLLIKNTFSPKSAGTLISASASKNQALICGISSIDNTVLLNVQGGGMIGVCGIAKRLFGALAEKGINIILITQGSSEHSICVAVSPAYAELAKEAIEKEFALEIQAYIIDEVSVEREMAVVAVVGENMMRTPGISGKLFGALGRNGINVKVIAQGSSELNITIAVRKEDEVKAIRVIHEAFFLSPQKTLNVFLVGTGLIGKTLLKQIADHAKDMKNKYAIDLNIIGLANSKSMIFNPKGISLDHWKELLDNSTEKMHISAFIDRMLEHNLINTAFVDCTSNQSVADAYEKILSSNISIVTPNKKANSGSYENYKKLRKAPANNGVKFYYGSNVGAGLPIISTINELIRSGDKILKIEAILSGTLSYLFNSFVAGVAFSEVVHNAQKKGFTEPDPREDLNGMDVARKLLILARESDYAVEMSDITVQKFLPEECFNASSLEDFYAKLKDNDTHFTTKLKEVHKENKALRYIAKFENGKGTIALQAVSAEHPFYHLSGSDNIVAITSEFYKENPLVIKGQGAGANVTAGKVFGDILRLGLERNANL